MKTEIEGLPPIGEFTSEKAYTKHVCSDCKYIDWDEACDKCPVCSGDDWDKRKVHEYHLWIRTDKPSRGAGKKVIAREVLK